MRSRSGAVGARRWRAYGEGPLGVWFRLTAFTMLPSPL
ncbi:hypothetical protein Taro_054490 [Colocasia esculenta]|uniref:Uncharacterized protein n=1 Tax=Colocasia esculenta TaxID=4460 RepID=A0A843XQU2_COLES|nr:hypothetical protein [Colocasia esculenta]